MQALHHICQSPVSQFRKVFGSQIVSNIGNWLQITAENWLVLQLTPGLSYIRHDSVLRLTVITMAVIFIAAYNLQVMVPLVASRMLGGSSGSLGIAMSFLGLGAVTGSLIIAFRVKPGLMMIAVGCGLLSFAHIWLSLLSGIYFSVTGVFLLDLSCGLFNVAVTGTLHVKAWDDMRGRVMSTYNIAILGSALIGAPLFGRLAGTIGVSETFLVIAVICAATALATTWAWIKNQNLGIVRFAAPVSPTAREQ